MMSWTNISIEAVRPLYEVLDYPGVEEPRGLYTQRYSRHFTELSIPELEDPLRYYDEALSYSDKGSSLLVFGSGHSFNSNVMWDQGSFSRIVAVDFVPAAKVGLYKEIEFYDNNILEGDLPVICDYVFSSHTLEHFYKEDLFKIVMPRLTKAARKAVIIVVPYADNWAGEPYHKCRFYEDDEFASLFDKYKIIREGAEIVYWSDI